MAYDSVLAERVRRLLRNRADVTEQAVVGGGLGFMIGGSLCCVVQTDGIAVRVGPDARQAALVRPHVHPHTVGTRVTSAFVVVDSEGCENDESLGAWIEEGIRFVATLAGPPNRRERPVP